MITKRFFISGIVTTAAVASASQFLPVEWPKPYATVYGVGWDFEVVEHDVWTQQDALKFAKFGIGGIDRFREITEIVYHAPMEPMPININRNWSTEPVDPIQRLRDMSNRPYTDRDTGVRYRLAEDMGPSAQVGIWDSDRAAKEDEKPRWAKYDYVNHSRKLGRDEA
jgi:hypothetical protein